MQISPITSSYFSNSPVNLKAKQNFCGFQNPIVSTYHANIESIQSRLGGVFYLFGQENGPAEKFAKRGALLLNLIHDMSLIDYICLTEGQKQILRKVTPNTICNDAVVHYDLATKLRTYINENFGDIENCTVLPIGRSMTSICETLKYMGHDIKYLPMSGMMEVNPYEFTPQQVKAYKEYLSSIGITRDIIKNNPNHNYIIFDYVTSGRSLANAHKFLTRPDMLGECPNVVTLKSTDVYGQDFEHYFYWRKFSSYSPVSILGPEDFVEVQKAANPYKYNYNHYRNSYDHLSRKLFKMQLFQILDNNNEINLLYP